MFELCYGSGFLSNSNTDEKKKEKKKKQIDNGWTFFKMALSILFTKICQN